MSQQPLRVTVISAEHMAELPDGPIVLRANSGFASENLKSRIQFFNPTWGSVSAGANWKSSLLECLVETASDRHVNYVVQGHPMLGDSTVQHLLDEDAIGLIELELFDQPLPVILTETLASVSGPPALVDVLTFAELDHAAPYSGGRWPASSNQAVIITNVIASEHGSLLAEQLCRRYDPGTEIRLIPMYGEPRQVSVSLGELSDAPSDVSCYLVLPVATGDTFQYSADDLQRLVARLRAPGGCPWDQEQTNLSLARNLVEETYELLDAIEHGDQGAIREEMGDYLLQAWMHAQIAEEAGQFNLDEVFKTVIKKLVRRHPHVFAATIADDSQAVLQTWDQIKQSERANAESGQPPTPLGDVPASLPSLMRAQSLIKRADRRGDNAGDVTTHIMDAISRLPDQTEQEAVRALIGIVRSAQADNIDLEQALRNWTREFERSVQAAGSAADPRSSGS